MEVSWSASPDPSQAFLQSTEAFICVPAPTASDK
jgi:hypothetical protein